MLDVAIIGAGLAAIAAGRELQRQGLQVALFDKSRGVGGRLATRRINHIPFDHGLPSWQPSGEWTTRLTGDLLAADILQPWRKATSSSNDPQIWQSLTPITVYAAPEGMTAIAKYLAQPLTINRGFRLEQLRPQDDHWQLSFDQQPTLTAKAVILAIPAPQAIALLPAGHTAPALTPITYEPTFSLMLTYEQPFPWQFPWQELQLTTHPILKTISLDGQKRSPQAPTLVVQTNGSFSREYLDTEHIDPISTMVITEITNTLDLDLPQTSQIHRWRYGIPDITLGQTHLNINTNPTLIACGDWCLGNGSEGAIASGVAASHAITTSTHQGR